MLHGYSDSWFSYSRLLPLLPAKYRVFALSTKPAVGLGRRRIPTLILWGDRDAGFVRAERDALLAILSGAKFEVYRGTGHAPHWEQPERVARDLEKFISG